jgi:SAM-dependent methyltransferase
MKCRHCYKELVNVFLDLGFAPISNAYLSKDDLKRAEAFLPLKLYVCEYCWLVQTEDYACVDDLFSSDYAYFSSVSSSWLKHAADYSSMIQSRLNLGTDSLVIEVASNDGYLLKNFMSARIPCLGIEPTASTAEVAERLGIPIIREFFGEQLAKRLVEEGKQADLIIGNNVYAHVPDINDFTSGMKAVLKPGGTITLEFPHLMRLIENNQFDTVYHEHFSYLALGTVFNIFEDAGLKAFDVEELKTHGGSLRVYGCHSDDLRSITSEVTQLIQTEVNQGLRDINTYLSFQSHADQVKNDLLEFLIQQKRAGRTIIAYGAAAKGNTLLNYAGIKPDLLPMVCDAAPSKQGKLLPGSHLPIVSPDEIKKIQPDWVLILPWNIADEVMQLLNCIRNWKGKFVTAIPEIRIY